MVIKKIKAEAPINEVLLASGMLQLAGWDGKGNFLDPMCGSGTLLIIKQQCWRWIYLLKFLERNLHSKIGKIMMELFTKIKEFRINRVKEFTGKL